MFFGGFLALLYVATNRVAFVGGRWACSRSAPGFLQPIGHVTPASRPGATRSTDDLRPVGGSYQIAQSLFAQADGGLCGRGFSRRCWKVGRRASAARRRRPT